jgi:serine/threonine protein kinase
MCVVGCSEDNGTCSYIMERMDKSLTEILDGNKVSIIRCVDIMLQIAEGMDYLHRMDLAHRDLNPDNIIVKRCHDPGSGGSKLAEVVEPLWIAKVSDFGTMKVMASTTQNTSNGRVYGRPMFRAPEAYEELPGRSHSLTPQERRYLQFWTYLLLDTDLEASPVSTSRIVQPFFCGIQRQGTRGKETRAATWLPTSLVSSYSTMLGWESCQAT